MMMGSNVIHNAGAKRFEVTIDGNTAVLDYIKSGNVICFTHTGVPPPLEGKGIGTALCKEAVKFATENQFQIQSTCWFVDGYLKKNNINNKL